MPKSQESDAGIYRGRLMSDGQGNLLAYEATRVGDKMVTVFDENGQPLLDGEGNELVVSAPVFRFGENHGRPVALHEGSYIFLSAGEASHNERHHKQFLEFAGTTDETAGDKGNEHHAAPLKSDPHYDADMKYSTRVRFSPDKVAATETGHTDAYEGQHETGGGK